MQNKINKKSADPDDLLYDEYGKMKLILGETIKELWKIIDSPKTSYKDKIKSISLILTITKERRLILEKEVDIIRTKIHENLFGKKFP